ncbi:MAG TPA: HAD family hydrolase [Thermodesulfobacteriota bacterium]|nr:HAD family hydrolase [Deltaproteobacteria bacterium]HNU71329.1 HAD family hydrolase [Thermodesulfobacteriota bacterium]
MNNHIKAFGFDLFNTLITVDPDTLDRSHVNLAQSLRENGFEVDGQSFKTAHNDAALLYLEQCRLDGRETHNRFWISTALAKMGFSIVPDDVRIAAAVEAYFVPFYDDCRLIPGTTEMLKHLRKTYRLGLLSNFTHGPAARRIIDSLGLAPYFDVILISGELGYRKPHSLVFERLVEALDTERECIVYVGDDPEPDIFGAQEAGLRPLWTTYVMDHQLPLPPRILSRGSGAPDASVPRISTWKDLCVYLQDVHR